MGPIENLNPDEWANVLSEGTEPAKMAKEIAQGKNLSWVETIIQNTTDSKKILDLGSGCGQNSAVLALKGKETTLLDWSQKNINFSKELYNHLKLKGTFIQGDMTQVLPFEDKSFDTIFSCGVLEYFTDEQIKDIFKEAKRVARKKIIILVPNSYAILYRIGMWYMRKNNTWQWGDERPFKTLKPHFQACSINHVKEFTVGTWHSLNFLTMPGGSFVQRVLRRIFNTQDNAHPSKFHQGYLLISIAEIN